MVYLVFFFGGGGLDFLCNFYEINSSQDFFCIAKILVLIALQNKEFFWGHNLGYYGIPGLVFTIDCKNDH